MAQDPLKSFCMESDFFAQNATEKQRELNKMSRKVKRMTKQTSLLLIALKTIELKTSREKERKKSVDRLPQPKTVIH